MEVKKLDKIDRVSIEDKNGRLRLRFTYPKGKRRQIYTGETNKKNLKAAKALANRINSDIVLHSFDDTLQAYGVQPEKKEEGTLLTAWEAYKIRHANIAAKTTQSGQWKQIDSLLSELPKRSLELSNLATLGNACLKLRSLSSVHRAFQSLQPALRQFDPKYKTISLKEQLPKLKKTAIEWFAVDEVKAILSAVETRHPSYYAYTRFCAGTGCRPEEAIALTWSDVELDGDGVVWVTFDKAHSRGILKAETKNHVIRKIPLSVQLGEFLVNEWQPKCPETDARLAFPSCSGDYICGKFYLRRVFKPVVTALIKQRKVRKYLPAYNLRHSYISNSHYIYGMSLMDLAGLVGDRPETVIKNYTGLRQMTGQQLPNIY